MTLPHLVKRMGGEIDFPRRSCVDQYTPVEEAIWAAHAQVEALGASTALTDAVILLQQAAEKVADFLEGISASSEPPASGPATDYDAGFRDGRERVLAALTTHLTPLGIVCKANAANAGEFVADIARQINPRIITPDVLRDALKMVAFAAHENADFVAAQSAETADLIRESVHAVRAALASAPRETTSLAGMPIKVSETVPAGEAWLVRGETEEAAAKIVGKVVGLVAASAPRKETAPSPTPENLRNSTVEMAERILAGEAHYGNEVCQVAQDFLTLYVAYHTTADLRAAPRETPETTSDTETK